MDWLIMESNIKVVILCGGMGTRLREETEYKPKPLVDIGGKPILWHIMKIYANYGFKDFVLCLGYKGNMIKEYFLNYDMLNSDFTIELESKKIQIHNSHPERDWQVTLAQTGDSAMTGARIKKVEKYVNSDIFMLTYGDGVANINISKLLEFHKSHGKIGTITGVNPISKFGELSVEGQRVIRFNEKPQINDGFINGGFFVFNKQFFKYLNKDDGCVLEKEPLENLAQDKELMLYKHTGFWHCMDTYRDFLHLNELWTSPNPPWKIWK
jgi:glucose-1-phosphate cytidylyltransferase